jgi:hypothetical protein
VDTFLSCWRRIAITCSSLNLLFFVVQDHAKAVEVHFLGLGVAIAGECCRLQ